MAKLSELALKDEPITSAPTDWESLPEQRGGGFQPLPQPGTYSFKQPANIDEAFSEVNVALVAAFRVTGQRVEVRYDSEHPLTIISEGEHKGERFDTSVNNIEINRAPKGQPEVRVPDMAYLLQAHGEPSMPPLGANKQFLAALSKHAGQAFTADIEWRASSKANKVRYIYNEEGKVVEDPAGCMGSGKKWYQSQIPRGEDGKYLERFGDPQGDGAVEAIRAFASLTRFTAYKGAK
jgi:hypothetical protein